MKSYQGVSGEIQFDTNMSDVAPLWLATVQDGRYRYAAAPEWEETRSSGSAPRPRVP